MFARGGGAKELLERNRSLPDQHRQPVDRVQTALPGLALTLVQAVPVIVVSLFIVCTGMFMAQAVAPALVNALAAANGTRIRRLPLARAGYYVI